MADGTAEAKAARLKNALTICTACAPMLQFTILGEAVPKGRARAFRTAKGIRFHTPAKTAGFEQQVRVLAQEAIEQLQRDSKAAQVPVPSFPLQGPVALTLWFFRGVPKSMSRKRANEAIHGRVVPTTRPDLDNCVKAVKDALNGVAWRDDAQIWSLQATKSFAETPRTLVKVTSLEDP